MAYLCYITFLFFLIDVSKVKMQLNKNVMKYEACRTNNLHISRYIILRVTESYLNPGFICFYFLATSQ